MLYAEMQKMYFSWKKIIISYCMPNAQCECCNTWLENICISFDDKIRLVKLVKKRRKMFLGVTYDITPGIKHKEVNLDSKCNGVLYYKVWAPTPIEFKGFNITCLFSANDDVLDSLIEDLEDQKEYDNYI